MNGKSTFLAPLLALAIAAPVAMAQDANNEDDQSAWTPLFNGEDLTGWTPKIKGRPLGDNYADTFRVEDGLLKVRFDKYEGEFNERFGHLFYERPLADYRLRVEYRVVGEQAEGGPPWANRNSGVMIYGQAPETMHRDQNFPVSIEVQLLGGQGGERPRPTANLCTPGTHVRLRDRLHTTHCTNSTSPTFQDDEWVTVEIEARGGESIKHFVGGELVLEYSQPQFDPDDADAKRLLDSGVDKMLTGGTISLQAESHPFDFRRVEVMKLQRE